MVGRRGGAEQRVQLRRGHAGREGVGRNPVGALGEDRHAVDDEGERLAPFVRLAPQLERAQADLVRPGVERPIAGGQLDFDPIERLGAEPVRPPQLRVRRSRLRGRRPAAPAADDGLDGVEPAVRMVDPHGSRQSGAVPTVAGRSASSST